MKKKLNFKENSDKPGYLAWPLITRPKSRGQVLLRSSDYRYDPRIIPNYLSHPDDVRVGIKGIREAIRVSKTQAMKKYGSYLYNSWIPGCERYEYGSDHYWECALRTYTMTIWHFSGTCKMGSDDDQLAVVDSNLKVI